MCRQMSGHDPTTGTVPSTGCPDSRQFAFVANPRPLILGSIIGGLSALVLMALWAWRNVRLRDPMDVVVVAFAVTAGLMAGGVSVRRRLLHARRDARSLGHIELDDRGVRWRQRDGSLGFDVDWKDVALATTDASNFTVLLRLLDGSPVLLGVLSEQHVPSGQVVLERFGELVEMVERKVPSAKHPGTKDPAAGRSVIGLGLLTCLMAGALYAANRELGVQLHWHRLLLLMPAVIGGIGLVIVIGGVRVRIGRGALISPLYGPGYRAKVVRFLVVAAVANFVLLGVMNGLAR
jgi:hypothetical protein